MNLKRRWRLSRSLLWNRDPLRVGLKSTVARGSAIIVEPFEPGLKIRLCLETAKDGYSEGEQVVEIDGESRQRTYELELDAFLATIAGDQPADRPGVP